MAEERLGASFSIDTTNLKAGLTQANRLIRESESQFKAAAAGMDDWTKSEAGLNAKIKSLSSTTELQKAKVNALQSEYNRLIDNGLDPASAEAVKLRTQINNETAALNKNQAELERQTKALDDLGNGSAQASEEIDKLEKEARESEGGFTVMKGAMANLVSQGFTALINGAKSAASAMVSLVKTSLGAAGELEQNMGGSEAVFKEYAVGMQKTAKEAFSNMGLSQSDFLANANKMGALFQGSGFSIKDSADMSAQAMQRAADVASIMGVDLSSAMEAVSGAAKGNFTMMDNLGVAMNDTTLQAYAQEKGLGKLETTQDKVGAAMQMFLEKTAYAAGNYAKENETLSGSLTTAKSALDNFLAGSGSVEDLVGAFSNAATVIVDKLDEIIPQLLSGITEIVEKIVPVLPPLIEKLLPAVIEGISMLIKGIVGVLPDIISTIVGIFPQLIQSILGMLPQILEAVIQIITAIIQGLADMLPDIVNAVLDVIPKLIDSLMAALPQLLDAAINLLMAIVDAIPVIITKLLNELPHIIKTIIDGLLNALPKLIDAGIKLFMAIVDAIPVILEALIEALPDIITTIINGLVSAIPKLIDGAIQFLMAIIQAIPTILKTLIKEIPTIVATIIATLLENLPALIKGAVELFMGLVKAIPLIIIELVKNLPQIITAIVEGLKEGVSAIKGVGSHLIKGLWNGIKDMGKWILDKIKGFGNSIVDGFKDIFGIHSPSKVMADEVGKNLALGIGTGFEKNIGDVNKQLADSMDFTDPDINVNASGSFGGKKKNGVVIYQTNNYSQAHSRYELYKSKQQTASAVKLAMMGV